VTVPKSFELVVGGRTFRVGYRRPGCGADGWVVFANAFPVATVERRGPDDWVVTVGEAGTTFRGRRLQRLVADAVRSEVKRKGG
jgi:hypothetical protein